MVKSKTPKTTIKPRQQTAPKTRETSNKEIMPRTNTTASNRKKKHSVKKSKPEDWDDEKKLVNCGLKILATSYNVTVKEMVKKTKNPSPKTKFGGKKRPSSGRKYVSIMTPSEEEEIKSKSEFSILNKKIRTEIDVDTSMPTLKSNKGEIIENKKPKMADNHGTMTVNNGEIRGKIMKTSKKEIRSRSEETLLNNNSIKEKNESVLQSNGQVRRNNRKMDPRLCAKYSILNLPRRRFWDRQYMSPLMYRKYYPEDNSDKQTYIYEELDSIVSALQIAQRSRWSLYLMRISGCLCGVLLVCLFIWYLFGGEIHKMYPLFRKRNIEQNIVKKYAKYIGGGLIHLITQACLFIRRVFSMPTQELYQPHPSYYRYIRRIADLNN